MTSLRDIAVVPMRLVRAAGAAPGRASHGLDIALLGVLMEIAARFAERKLLAAAESTVPDPTFSDQA